MSMSNHTPLQPYNPADVSQQQQPIQPDHPPSQHRNELNGRPIQTLMWQNGQSALPQPNAGSSPSFSDPQDVMNNTDVPGKHTTRRSRNFVPSHRKDEFYWIKRRKNNEAARRSREKRRTNDLILAQKVLLLLQENLQLKKDLLAVRAKYNEVGPDEMSEFHRKMTDGDLISTITQNLSLADYGIPDGVIKTFCNGMELDFSAQRHLGVGDPTSPTAAMNVSPFVSEDTSEYYSNDSHDQRTNNDIGSSSTSEPLPIHESRQSRKTNDATRQYQKWVDTTSASWPETKHCKTSRSSPKREWKYNSMQLEDSSAKMDVRQHPFVGLGTQSTASTSSSASEESMTFSSSSSIADAQMLQDFVQMSWREASESYKSPTSSSDEAQKDGGSCPRSDYSSFSDSNSINSHSSSPKEPVNNDESNECSSSDEKGHRLPYKLRFKLAGMQSQYECNP